MTETRCTAPLPGSCPLDKYGLHRCTAPTNDHPLSAHGIVRVVVHRCACGYEWTQTRKGDDTADTELALD